MCRFSAMFGLLLLCYFVSFEEKLKAEILDIENQLALAQDTVDEMELSANELCVKVEQYEQAERQTEKELSELHELTETLQERLGEALRREGGNLEEIQVLQNKCRELETKLKEVLDSAEELRENLEQTQTRKEALEVQNNDLTQQLNESKQYEVTTF